MDTRVVVVWSRLCRTLSLAITPMAAILACLVPSTAQARMIACAQLANASTATTQILAARSVEGRLPAEDEVKGRGAASTGVDPYLSDLPVFCRVNAILKPVPASRIEVELWLPQTWNGKLLGIGSHGFGGNFERGDMAMALRRGYAVVTSDLGHSSRVSLRQADFNIGDASFARNNEAAVDDFAWRATHEMTVTAKSLVRRFYGKAARRSYFDGCSNGGRQAIREAQQFPADYDGILAGSAAMYWTRSFAATATYFQAGMLPGGKITQAKLALAQRAAIGACDSIDGANDNLISDPRRCGWKASQIICRPGQDPASCLTADEASAIDRVHAPIVKPGTQQVLYDGLPPGSEASWRNMIVFNAVTANFYRHMVTGDAAWTPGPDTDIFSVLAQSEAPGSPGMRINSTNPDLSAFRAHGGKLIQYHGWADPSFGGSDPVRYYEEVVDLAPGTDKVAATQSYYRLFMAPGMAHCYGGQGPVNFGGLDHAALPSIDADHDILEALDRWVEKGDAPKQVIATEFTDERKVRRQMPLCPYPQLAHFTGGDVLRAENFECKAPAE